MRYDVGRFRRPMRRGVMEQMVSLISLGDGSTLTLDFTTGVLDPRLTFTRGSNATFINSQGLVQFADANLLQRSQDYTVAVWSKSRIDTTTSGLNTANTTTAPDGTNTGLLLKSDGVSGTHRVLQSNGTTGSTALSANGLSTVTLSAYFKANGSNFCSLKVANNIESRGVTRNFNLTNGVVSGAEDVGWTLVSASASPVGNGWYRCQITVGLTRVDANDDQMGIWLFVANGPDVADRSFTNSAASVWVWGAQVSIGANALEYRATTTAPYQAPRFDHDPTTLAPRGLLVEGTSTNLLNWSESFATSGGTNNNWTDTSITRTTGQTDPANGTTAIRFTASAGNATVISSAAIGTSAARTFSVWLRRVTGTGDIQYTQNNGTNWTTQAITSTWTRYTFTHTVDHRVGIRIVTSGDAIEMWGAQLETGSGASSYIPTGASQGTRNADECSMTGTNFSSWFNAGSSYSMLFRYSLNNPSAFAGASVDRAAGTLSVSGGGNRTFIHAAYRTTSGSGDEGRFVRIFDTGTLDLIPATLPAAASNTRLAFAVDTNNAGLSAANQSLGTDSACTILTGQNQLELGRVGSSQFLNGCISLVKYWPTRLPNAQLQSLTT